MKKLLRSLFPRQLWNRTATALFLSLTAVILWFDIEWCSSTSFQAMSQPETWINTLLLALLLSLPAMMWHLRKTQAVIITLVALWLECNLMYSRTYFTAIPLSSYLLAGNLGDFTASVADSLRWLDLGFILPVAWAWCSALGRSPQARLVTTDRLLYFGYIGLIGALSCVTVAPYGGLRGAWEARANANYHVARVPMFTVAGSLINDAMTANRPLSEADRKKVEKYLGSTPPLKPLEGNPGRDNLVLILCESLESWVIGLEVEGKEITPCLNRLVADSTTLYAPSVLSQVGAGRSIDGQLLINAGLLPMQRGVYAMERVFNEYPTLTKAFAGLRSARSALLTVDKTVTWNQGAVASAFGIDTVIARDSWVNDEKVGSRKKLGDRSFARQIVGKMEAGEIWPEGQNAFIQIVTYSGHNPFVLPEALDNLRLTGTYPPVVRNYLTMAHYTDEAVGILVDYIRSRPDSDRTLILITGDHEGLAADRESAAASSPFVSSAPFVPLIVANSSAGGHFTKIMGQVDIYPTILQLAGLTAYPWHGLGRSILDPAFPGVAVGSQGAEYGTVDSIPSGDLGRLRDARAVSDLIISYDLLKPGQ